MALRDQLADLGLSYEETAERLNEAGVRVRSAEGERMLTADDVSRRSSRRAQRSWREALGLEAEPAEPRFIRSPGQASELDPGPGAGSVPPSTLPAPVELPFEALSAKKRIVLIYTGIGQGLERFSPRQVAVNAETGERVVLPKPRYAAVFAQHAPKLADAWIEAARQNTQVARIVTVITTGGAVGELVVAHVSLVFSCLVISGKVPLNGILRELGPDAIVDGKAAQDDTGDGPVEPGAVRAVADDAEAPPR